MEFREISIKDFDNVTIGQAEDVEGATGCTVVMLGRDGAAVGLDVRGGGPASRESQMLQPLAAIQRIHALVLSGGSAFGLGAAGGVMKYLQERGIGYPVGPTTVPLVSQADLFDLTVGSPSVYPDEAMGYQACLNAGNYQDGCHGAGIGATIGKAKGGDSYMKSGIGSYAVQIGELKAGALVAVNCYGSIYDWRDGSLVAGPLTDDKTGFCDCLDLMLQSYAPAENKFVSNTTLGIVLTNADFNKVQLMKLAGMTHNGYARAIRPVHTSADGDSIFAASVGTVSADLDKVGALSAHVMSEAILRAVRSAESAYGFTALRDIRKG